MTSDHDQGDPGQRDDALCCASVVDAPLAEDEATRAGPGARGAGRPGTTAAALPGGLPGGDLLLRPRGALAKSQPTISHHTKVLAEAGLLVGEKRGRWMWWRVEPDRLAAVRKALGG